MTRHHSYSSLKTIHPAYLKRTRRMDAVSRIFIKGCGFVVIGCVILILLLIAREAIPLFLPPQVEQIQSFSPGAEPNSWLAGGMDDYLDTGFGLNARGELSFFKLKEGVLLETKLLDDQRNQGLHDVWSDDNELYTVTWQDGTGSLAAIHFDTAFEKGKERSIVYDVKILADFQATASGMLPNQSICRQSEEGSITLARLYNHDHILLQKQIREEDFLGNVTRAESSFTISLEKEDVATTLLMDSEGSLVYVGTEKGEILIWDIQDLDEVSLVDQIRVPEEEGALAVMGLLFGEESLITGSENGSIHIFSPVTVEGSSIRKREHIHTLTPHETAVRAILPSRRNKTLITRDSAGQVFIHHATSERLLFRLDRGLPLAAFSLAGRGNGLITLDKKGQVDLWELDIPHPEISWQTLFGKVWYETYDEPRHVWQSSSGSDDFEPKLSLVTLLFGSIKGTLYAMIFAAPLALLGAMYLSHFARPEVRGWVKPMVEILAAVPSVVIGFLAALWFAPIVEGNFMGILLLFPLTMIALVLMILLWPLIRHLPILHYIGKGYEFLAFIPVLFVTLFVAFQTGPYLNEVFFEGHWQTWVFEHLGVQYDQRNCFIIAFALGFAVIPIIFSITDDALSRVPPNLSAASLALGASRWQTMFRVILPSGSPGIFAALMIGLGRAVGETMIVLMATGNTPIMDLSIFNGMRTLSANIAVEMPEAPHGGTLYRVLFLSAILLFMLTSVLNTAAEVIRHRLRKKYATF